MSQQFSRKYDDSIRTAAHKWLPLVPWKLLKAQYYQESRLDPNARSPAGAEGIAQFMPKTAADIWPRIGYGIIDRRQAGPSIEAGAYYMSTLRRAWTSKRPERDRHSLALASYNAGLGNILQAQHVCGGPVLYDLIMSCLPSVTGRHADETLGYAPRIYMWWQKMELQ